MRILEVDLVERKTRILHKAYELFCELGIHDVTLEQVAKKAGLSRSSIYRYFETKANLLWHTQNILWEEIVAQIIADGQERFSSAQSGLEEVSELLYRFKDVYERHNGYLLFASSYKAYLVEKHIKLPEREYTELLRPVTEIFMAALRRGHQDGTIDCQEDLWDQFFATWGAMRAYAEQVALYDKMYSGENPWKSRFDLVHRSIMKGLQREDKRPLNI